MLATVTRILNRARLRGRMHVANLNRNKHLGCGAVGSHLPCNRLHFLSISSRPAMSRPTPPSLLALVLIAGTLRLPWLARWCCRATRRGKPSMQARVSASRAVRRCRSSPWRCVPFLKRPPSRHRRRPRSPVAVNWASPPPAATATPRASTAGFDLTYTDGGDGSTASDLFGLHSRAEYTGGPRTTAASSRERKHHRQPLHRRRQQRAKLMANTASSPPRCATSKTTSPPTAGSRPPASATAPG